MSRHEENRRKIEFLSQYINAGKEYDEVMQSYDYFRQKIVSLQASIITDMPRAGSILPDKIGGHVARLEQLEQLIDGKLGKLQELRTEIENVIGRVDDSLQRRLLHLRYIDGMKWEEVAVFMNYSWRQIHYCHSDALNKITIGGI